MLPHILYRETTIKRNISEVFSFFSKAENLNKITPPELGFEITSKLPIRMEKGAIIDYKIFLNGIPFNWKTEITEWEPPFRFVDSQLKGPYKMWVHEHSFEDKGDFTLMKDKVEYISPGGFLEFIPHKLFVENKVNKIFDYRATKFKELFP